MAFTNVSTFAGIKGYVSSSLMPDLSEGIKVFRHIKDRKVIWNKKTKRPRAKKNGLSSGPWTLMNEYESS